MFYLPLSLFNYISLLLPLHNFYHFPSSSTILLFSLLHLHLLIYSIYIFRLHYAIQHETIRFILAVLAEHRRYNNTLYNIFYYIQICGVRTRTELSDSLHRIQSEQRPEKTCRKKNPLRKKLGRKSG